MRSVPGSLSPSLSAALVPYWTKYTVSEADFTAAAALESITLYTMVAGEILHAIKIKHSTSFTGGAVADYTLEVGIAGDTAKYAGAFDVFQAVANNTFQLSFSGGAESHAAGTVIQVTARCATDDMADAAAGAADIWVLKSRTI